MTRPLPKDNEKKDWPMAAMRVEPVTFEKSGLKIYLMPSWAPGRHIA